MDLPIVVNEIGRYEVSIVSMSDISDCEQMIYETDRLSTTVEVVESARIVPVSQNKDLCVGDTLDFLLQGKAPWTIE
jgi:nucleoporin POM152